MPEATPVVNPGEQTPAAPTPANTEQVTPASESVTTPKTDVQENLKRALKQEREKTDAKDARIAELEAQLQSNSTPMPQTQNEPTPIERTFYETVAKTNLMFMAKKDPFIDKNIDLIEAEMLSSGSDAAAATNAVKARILDSVLRDGGQAAETQVPPTQITSTPLPEDTKPELTGNSYQDARSGKITDLNEEESALVEALGRA